MAGSIDLDRGLIKMPAKVSLPYLIGLTTRGPLMIIHPFISVSTDFIALRYHSLVYVRSNSLNTATWR